MKMDIREQWIWMETQREEMMHKYDLTEQFVCNVSALEGEVQNPFETKSFTEMKRILIYLVTSIHFVWDEIEKEQ